MCCVSFNVHTTGSDRNATAGVATGTLQACPLKLPSLQPRQKLTRLLVLEDAQDIISAEQDELLLLNGHLVTTILRQQHRVVLLEVHRDELAIGISPAGPNREDDALVQLGLRRLRQQDATDRLGGRLDALDQDAVQERDQATSGLCGGVLRGSRNGAVARHVCAHVCSTVMNTAG